MTAGLIHRTYSLKWKTNLRESMVGMKSKLSYLINSGVARKG